MARDLNAEIQSLIEQHRIFVFMKGSPEAPQCGFSATTSRIFQILGKPFGSFDVLRDQEIREGVKAFSNWPTIPQVYVDGTFLGGCDIVREMYESGELEQLVEKSAEASAST